MIINKIFKERVKALKPCSQYIMNAISKKTRSFPKQFFVLSFGSTLLLSGCSTIQTAVSNKVEAVKTDVQSQHDEVFRIKRVRKALASGHIEEACKHRDTLYMPHWKCIANIEIATTTYAMEAEGALEMISSTVEEIWSISDPNDRAMALIALLKFELETKKDIPAAEEIIKQTEKTIEYIVNNDFFQKSRIIELDTLLQKNNHLLSR